MRSKTYNISLNQCTYHYDPPTSLVRNSTWTTFGTYFPRRRIVQRSCGWHSDELAISFCCFPHLINHTPGLWLSCFNPSHWSTHKAIPVLYQCHFKGPRPGYPQPRIANKFQCLWEPFFLALGHLKEMNPLFSSRNLAEALQPSFSSILTGFLGLRLFLLSAQS